MEHIFLERPEGVGVLIRHGDHLEDLLSSTCSPCQVSSGRRVNPPRPHAQNGAGWIAVSSRRGRIGNGAYLGGHLAATRKVGSHHPAYDEAPPGV